MVEPLPSVSEFLIFLGEKGIPVSVREHLIVARLLHAMDGQEISNPRNELRGALASLLGKSPEEVLCVQTLFDAFYPTSQGEEAGTRELAGVAPPPKPTSPPPRRRRRHLGFALGTATLLAAAALLFFSSAQPVSGPPDGGMEDLGSEGPGMDLAADDDAVTERASPDAGAVEGEPPAMPRAFRPDWSAIVCLGGILFALLFGALWIGRIRARSGARLRSLLREELEALPGPGSYALALQFDEPAVPRGDLDDLATLLGRLFRDSDTGQELDVQQTVHQTLRRGMFPPTLVYRPIPSRYAILILEDQDGETLLFGRQVRGLLQGLKQRGIALEHWLFQGDASVVWRDPGSAPISIEELWRTRRDHATLVVSTGAGAGGSFAQLSPWVKKLRRFARCVWLNPITDLARWRPVLQDRGFPIPVWPLSRLGLRGLAYDLAMDRHRRVHINRAKLVVDRRVQKDDVEQLRALAQHLPLVQAETLDWLRQRYLRDVPKEILLPLAHEALRPGDRFFRWPRPWTAAIPQKAPIRRLLEDYQDLLDRSRPVLLAGEQVASLAFQRWRLDRAILWLYLAPISPDYEKLSIFELERLARSALWEEVQEALGQVGLLSTGQPALRSSPALPPGATHHLRQTVVRVLHGIARGQVPAEMRPPKGFGGWVWPGPRELLLPLAALAPLVGLAAMSKLYPHRPLEHVESYRVTLTVSGERRQLRIRATQPGVPTRAQLYRDQDGPPVATVAVGVPWTLAEDSADHSYHVQAALGPGNTGYSRQLLVPGLVAVGQGTLRVRLYSGATEQLRIPLRVIDSRGMVHPGRSGDLLRVALGSSLVLAEVATFEPVRQRVEIAGQGLKELPIALLASPPRRPVEPLSSTRGSLLLRLQAPGVAASQVLVGAQRWNGRSPIRDIDPGPLKLRIVHPLYEYEEEVTIDPGQTTRFIIEALPVYGEVTLKVSPEGAQLTKHFGPNLETKEIGHANVAGIKRYLLRGQAGTYGVLVWAKGYIPNDTKVSIEAGETRSAPMQIQLEPEQRRKVWPSSAGTPDSGTRSR